MLLPYASDRPLTRTPLLTWTLMTLHVAMMLLVTLADRLPGGWNSATLFSAFGITPAHFQPYTLLTYTFFHESGSHLLSNLFFLWVFGGGVEEAVGRWRYLLLYLAGGVVGGGLQCLVTNALSLPFATGRPIIGASAACAGLMGIFAVRYYRTRLTLVGIPWRPHVVAVIGMLLTIEVVGALWSLSSGSGADSVAHWAHIGGFVFGLTMGQIFRLETVAQLDYIRADAAQAMNKSEPGTAIRHWEKLLAREPNNTMARVELARAWLLLGDTEQATLHYLAALRERLLQNQRAEAALLYAEMREHDLRTPAPPTELLFPLGSALEESENFALAAEILRSVTTRHPDAPEAETALLKVIQLYVHRLNRREEGRVLAHLFLERYPRSQFRTLAQDLERASSA